MKDRLATIYAKILSFSTPPFEKRILARMSVVIRAFVICALQASHNLIISGPL